MPFSRRALLGSTLALPGLAQAQGFTHGCALGRRCTGLEVLG